MPREANLENIPKDELKKVITNLENMLEAEVNQRSSQNTMGATHATLLLATIGVPAAVFGGTAYAITKATEYLPRHDWPTLFATGLIINTCAFLSLKDICALMVSHCYKGYVNCKRKGMHHQVKIDGLEQEIESYRIHL